MKKRIITGLILCVILVPLVLFKQLETLFQFLIMAFVVGAAIEMLNMYDHAKKYPWGLKIMVILCTLILYVGIMDNVKIVDDNGNYVSVIFRAINKIGHWIRPDLAADTYFQVSLPLVLAFVFLVIFSMLVFVDGFDATDFGRFITVIMYLGISFAALTCIRLYGRRYLIFLILTTMMTDIFALVFGITLGKGKNHKLAPKISPKKSWEGAIGGSLVAVAFGSCYMFFYQYFAQSFHDDMTPGETYYFFQNVFDQAKFSQGGWIVFVILLALLISVCGQIGDLTASKLKRSYGIKDYSNIFPGHGGILDRFDSTLFTATVFFLLIQFESVLFTL